MEPVIPLHILEKRIESLREEQAIHHREVKERMEKFNKLHMEHQNYLLESDRKAAQYVAVIEEIGGWIETLQEVGPQQTSPPEPTPQ